MYIDTHCHMDFPDFDQDRKEVVENAARNGVSYIINIGIDTGSSSFSVEMARENSIFKAVVGIHPSEVGDADSRTMKMISKLAKEDNVVGIGETGLDFHRGREFERKQKDFLLMHIQLAGFLGLPLVVHQRDSRDEIIGLFEKEKLPGKVVFHCFGGDPELAAYCRDKGFYISFTGIITFGKAEDVRKSCSEYPGERIMAETDAPFLSPEPFRGKRNDPSKISYVVEKISEARKEEPAICGKRVFENSREFFKI